MKKTIVGNWKMHGTPETARALAQQITAASASAEVVICPPFVLLAAVKEALAGSNIKLGAQDCHAQAEGAYTGDICAGMLKSLGCAYVIVGHSERRSHYHETDAQVQAKAAQALKAGLTAIICIGETEAERASGKALETVGKQVKASLPDGVSKSDFLLAYEPVWAIGSGKVPTMADIAQMHAHIQAVAGQKTGLAPEAVSVLYGGSVKSANAGEILATKGVSGVLVGGASLKADEFCGIIAAA